MGRLWCLQWSNWLVDIKCCEDDDIWACCPKQARPESTRQSRAELRGDTGLAGSRKRPTRPLASWERIDLTSPATEASCGNMGRTEKGHDPASGCGSHEACLETCRDGPHGNGESVNSPIHHLWGEKSGNLSTYLERTALKYKETGILLIGSFKVHIRFPATPGL